jgi:hypothetical protein
MTLIRIKDKQVKALAISLAKKALTDKTPTGGKKKRRLTQREIQVLIHKAEIKIQGEQTGKDEQEEGTQNPSAALIAATLCEKPSDQNQPENGEPTSPPESVPSQPLSSPATETTTQQFIVRGLSSERIKVLDAMIEAGNAKTHLEAIEYFIDSATAKTGTDAGMAVPTDDHFQLNQKDSRPISPQSGKPWVFPTRLSEDEFGEFAAEFIRICCDPECQLMVWELIDEGKFADERAFLNFAFNLIIRLKEIAESFTVVHNQLQSSEHFLRFPIDPKCFAPLFPTVIPENINQQMIIPDICVIGVTLDVIYSQKRGLP